MSEIEQLRQQMAEMRARLDHYERYGTKLPQPPHEEKPNGALTDRLDASFLRRLDKLKRQLASIVSQRYAELCHADNLRDSLPSNSATPETGQAFVDAVPRHVAAMLTREDQVRQELAGAERAHTLRGGNEAKLARLQVELAAVSQHTQTLLRSVTLPPMPPELHHAIASLGQSRHTSTLPAHMSRAIRG